MATRILMNDVEAFVRDTLLKIRAGLAAATEQGISTEMPEEVSFTLEIITAPQSMEQVTETENNETSNNPTETTTEAEATDTTEETLDGDEVTTEAAAEDTTEETLDGDEVTTEAAAEDAEHTERSTAQESGEGGSDSETTEYKYTPMED